MDAGNLPKSVDHQAVRHVEIGQTAAQVRIEPVQTGDGVPKSVADQRCRVDVNALAPSVGCLELHAVAHLLDQLGLEGMIRRVAFPEDRPDRARIRIEQRPAAGPQIAFRRLGGHTWDV